MKQYVTEIVCRNLPFKTPARTSRGEYHTRTVWYVKVSERHTMSAYGVGECAPLPDLSCDAGNDYESSLIKACRFLEERGELDSAFLENFPSIQFGLETALQHLAMGSYALWDTSFSRGKTGIPINGLIWMASKEKMLEQIQLKLEQGFRCVKLKIGAIDFDDELNLLKHIRNNYTKDQVEIRVDANGAFQPRDALKKLNALALLDIHSIEQPIKAGHWNAMRELSLHSLLAIALDEEMIGINTLKEKEYMLDTVCPSYIVLKPSLHGGIKGCKEWISLASSRGIGWWVTSALESNIGLNAIAQWVATLGVQMPQGLGTGMLFTENVPLPLSVKKDLLWFDPTGECYVWDGKSYGS